jgi:hypothetical protein
VRLFHARDTTNSMKTIVKVKKICYPDGSVDLVVHQIEGVYETEEAFDMEWNMTPDKEGLVNFISLDLVDARKLMNALIEEIQS